MSQITVVSSGGGGGGSLNTLTGNTGGAISPVAGNINTVGGNNITASGSGNTITFDVTGTTNHAVQVGNASGSLTSIPVGTNGQVLLGSTGVDPVFATLTSAGGSITFTPGAGTLNLEAAAVTPGIPWTVVTGATQALAVNNGYIANNAGMSVMTLPVTAAVGTIIRVTGINNNTGWRIAQNASQLIHFGSQATTTGVAGSLTSFNTFDSVEIVCVIANTTWNVLSSQGNITFV